MAVKRKTYRLNGGNIVDVEEFHDGNYGAPGKERKKKKKPTAEQMKQVNRMNKQRRCRQRLLQYFNHGDCFATWTYEVKNKPPDMQTALDHFQKAIRQVRNEYRKRGYTLFWIRNIERGTKGAWHIHLVVNEIGDTASILQRAWDYGGTYTAEIKKCKYYDEDFTQLSSYMTKDENSREEKTDGTPVKPKIKEASYNSSRNMPLPEPKEEILLRWKEEPHVKKGYVLLGAHEGINPVTGFKYRRYTLMRILGKEGKDADGRHLHRDKPKRAGKRKRKGDVHHENHKTKRRVKRDSPGDSCV